MFVFSCCSPTKEAPSRPHHPHKRRKESKRESSSDATPNAEPVPTKTLAHDPKSRPAENGRDVINLLKLVSPHEMSARTERTQRDEAGVPKLNGAGLLAAPPKRGVQLKSSADVSQFVVEDDMAKYERPERKFNETFTQEEAAEQVITLREAKEAEAKVREAVINDATARARILTVFASGQAGLLSPVLQVFLTTALSVYEENDGLSEEEMRRKMLEVELACPGAEGAAVERAKAMAAVQNDSVDVNLAFGMNINLDDIDDDDE